MLDAGGYDLLEGLGLNRSATARQHVNIVYSSSSCHPVVDECDTLTLVVDGNAVASAQMTIDLYYTTGV